MRFFLRYVISIACMIIMASFLASIMASDPGVELGGKRFTVEVADTRARQALGLMYRDSMPADHGMLFIFQDEAPRSFWMKNTRIPLDIMYFNKDLELVSTSANTPPCRTRHCSSYPSKAPAMFVLELNAGMASQLGVKVGDRLILDLD